MLVDPALSEVSGLAASRQHADVLWVHNDGGSAPRIFAISKRGARLAAFDIAGVRNTDWEDIAAFDLDGRHYLLLADTGDNGGLRHALQLHVVEEPADLSENAAAKPLRVAWSIAFRWPDGPRDCEAVAVDVARNEVLLVSKKRQPPELFTLPLRGGGGALQVARQVGTLAGVPRSSEVERRAHPERARVAHQVTAADISPDNQTLAVLTYRDLLLYPRGTDEDWAQATARLPEVHALPWLPQAEALGWAADGSGLYATGEFSPAPMLFLVPDARRATDESP